LATTRSPEADYQANRNSILDSGDRSRAFSDYSMLQEGRIEMGSQLHLTDSVTDQEVFWFRSPSFFRTVDVPPSTKTEGGFKVSTKVRGVGLNSDGRPEKEKNSGVCPWLGQFCVGLV
jgi:hypothetical protein